MSISLAGLPASPKATRAAEPALRGLSVVWIKVKEGVLLCELCCAAVFYPDSPSEVTEVLGVRMENAVWFPITINHFIP